MQWRLSGPGRVFDRGEGLLVYFHVPSGDTHLLSALAGRVLAELKPGECSVASLTHSLQDALEPGTSVDRELQLEGVLHDLAAIDLVEECDP